LLLDAMLVACGGGGGGGGQPLPAERLTLTALVRNAASVPLAGVEVLIGNSTNTTGADGTLTYDNLLPGRYVVSLEDQAGNFDCRALDLAEGNTDFTFTLPNTEAGFHATRVDPALNAAGASLNGPLRVTFNAAVQPGSVSSTDFTATPAIGSLTAQVTGDTVELQPSLQLPKDQNVLIEMTGGIQSVGGTTLSQPLRWRFRTAASDTFPPLLIDSQPSDGATGFPPNMAVILEFGESLLVDNANLVATADPPADLNIAVNGRSVLIDASGGWQINTPYTLELSGVADAAGNTSAELFDLHFTTGDQAAPHQDVQPDWNRVTDSIVFASNRLGGYDIFSIHPDGTGLVRLTDLPGDELHPSLSSDGALLCFQRRGDDGDWDIFVQGIDGGEAAAVTGPGFNDFEPVFSRTFSRDIFFTSDRSGGASVFLMHSDGSNPTELDRAFGFGQSQPAPHPLLDRQLLFTAQRGDNLSIWRKTISAADGSVVNINLTENLVSDERSPCWSADAGLIGFVSDLSGVNSLWVADAAGSFPRQVTFFDQPLDDPAIAPTVGDNRCVVSLASADGGSSLVIVDLVSGSILVDLTGQGVGD
jgi:Tol biopolymer transport system component